MLAMILTLPPQRAHCSTSMRNTLFSRCAQPMARGRSAGLRSVLPVFFPRPARVISARSPLCGRTPRGNGSGARRADGRERLWLCVEDDGPGIPEPLRGIVTERGMRADTRQPGQGIGLAIVRDIVVEAYGGELRVDTSQLGGARVEVTI